MEKVIIGIHGLGNKPPGPILQNWWKLAMEEGIAKISRSLTLPHFELVYWADILYDKPLDESVTDRDDPNFIDEKYALGQANLEPEDRMLRQKVLDFVEEQLDKLFLNEDLSINYGDLSDAIIGRYFRDLNMYYAAEVLDTKDHSGSPRSLIRSRLADVLQKYAGDEIILISHSMGSIISYDVLTFLVPEIEIQAFITMGSPLGFPVVQGKIAAEWSSKRLVPPKLKTPPGVVNHWYNFADLKDKIALVYKLADNYGPNWRDIKPEDFVVQNDYMNEGEANHHKSFGYLRAKQFSEILLQLIEQPPSNFFKRMKLNFRNVFKPNF